jgi:hypothetical protein
MPPVAMSGRAARDLVLTSVTATESGRLGVMPLTGSARAQQPHHILNASFI